MFLITPNGHIFYTVTKEADFNTNSTIGLIIVIAFTVALIGVFIAKSVGTPITEIALVAQQVAADNLTASVKKTSNDEIGALQEAIGNMISNLSRMVNNISGIAIQKA